MRETSRELNGGGWTASGRCWASGGCVLCLGVRAGREVGADDHVQLWALCSVGIVCIGVWGLAQVRPTPPVARTSC